MTTQPIQPRAGVIYRGPSMIDGSPIVCVATYTKSNSKTGAMLQTYILHADISPIDAIRAGTDAAVCGDCKHRGEPGIYSTRSCYVNIGQGPTVVWRAMRRGSYAFAQPHLIGMGRMIRLGTYGDPAAVPDAVWANLLEFSEGHTGYTHQWRGERFAHLSRYCMASVDTPAEAIDARAAGWRTFRVRVNGTDPAMPYEFACPASTEMGAKTTCQACKACNGNDTARRGNPMIIAHGALARRFAINQLNRKEVTA